MKTVRLPIFEDGIQNGEFLEIDIRHFVGEAGSEIANRYMRIDPCPTPQEEIEQLDRIIHGFPPITYENREGWTPLDEARSKGWIKSKHEERAFDFNPTEVRSVDAASKQPHIDEWRHIPGFEDYKMSSDHRIVNANDDAEVQVMRGRHDNVLLLSSKGDMVRMSIKVLFNHTFPELNK